MVSKAWDGSLKPPGLIVERRAVIDGVVEMSGRLAAALLWILERRQIIDLLPDRQRDMVIAWLR
jgi:hypothetical protein